MKITNQVHSLYNNNIESEKTKNKIKTITICNNIAFEKLIRDLISNNITKSEFIEKLEIKKEDEYIVESYIHLNNEMVEYYHSVIEYLENEYDSSGVIYAMERLIDLLDCKITPEYYIKECC